jgi:transposase
MDNHKHRSRSKGSNNHRETEVKSGGPLRQHWSAEERARIVAESFEPGSKVSAVARRHGVSRGVLHVWRKKARASQPSRTAADQPIFVPPVFVPVTVPKPSSEEKPARLSHGGMIEIEIDGALIRISSRADKETLRFVLAELRRAR